MFVNPPFGVSGGQSLQGLFFERCAREFSSGRIKQAVLLLKAGVGYQWFRSVMRWPVCFLWERLAFVQRQEDAAGEAGELQWGVRVQNPHGSIVLYMGPDAQRFVDLFSTVGSSPGAIAWAHCASCGDA